jgi:hypothetical protein
MGLARSEQLVERKCAVFMRLRTPGVRSPPNEGLGRHPIQMHTQGPYMAQSVVCSIRDR